jgi:hypothetical protein
VSYVADLMRLAGARVNHCGLVIKLAGSPVSYVGDLFRLGGARVSHRGLVLKLARSPVSYVGEVLRFARAWVRYGRCGSEARRFAGELRR